MPTSDDNDDRSDTAFSQAVKHARTALRSGQDRVDALFWTDFCTILHYPDRVRAVLGIEDLADVPCAADVEGPLRALAIGMRLDSNQWEGFERAATRAEEACQRMPSGEERDTVLGLLVLGRGHLRRNAGDTEGAATIFRGLTTSKSGYVVHLAETQLGLLALEQGKVADAEMHFCRSVQATGLREDRFFVFRGYSTELCDALDRHGTQNPDVQVHMRTVRTWRPFWRGPT